MSYQRCNADILTPMPFPKVRKLFRCIENAKICELLFDSLFSAQFYSPENSNSHKPFHELC